MCLYRTDSKINKKALKREGKYVICWKVVDQYRGKYYPQYWHEDRAFKKGWNVSTRKRAIPVTIGDPYIPHFHAFMTKSGARKWAGHCSIVIKCKTHLKYITTTDSQTPRVLVTSKIWIPACPDKE